MVSSAQCAGASSSASGGMQLSQLPVLCGFSRRPSAVILSAGRCEATSSLRSLPTKKGSRGWTASRGGSSPQVQSTPQLLLLRYLVLLHLHFFLLGRPVISSLATPENPIGQRDVNRRVATPIPRLHHRYAAPPHVPWTRLWGRRQRRQP